MVALGISTSLGGILSGCRHARLHPKQTRQIVESGRATIARVMVSDECAAVEIGSGQVCRG